MPLVRGAASAHALKVQEGSTIETLVIGMIVFLVLHVLTARIFAPYMPERMITHRSIVGTDSYLPKRWGLWLGAIGSLVLSLVGLMSQSTGHAARSPSTILVVQGILYLVTLYIYALNIRAKRRGG